MTVSRTRTESSADAPEYLFRSALIRETHLQENNCSTFCYAPKNFDKSQEVFIDFNVLRKRERNCSAFDVSTFTKQRKRPHELQIQSISMRVAVKDCKCLINNLLIVQFVCKPIKNQQISGETLIFDYENGSMS